MPNFAGSRNKRHHAYHCYLYPVSFGNTLAERGSIFDTDTRGTVLSFYDDPIAAARRTFKAARFIDPAGQIMLARREAHIVRQQLCMLSGQSAG